MPRILLIGATGPTGLEVLAQLGEAKLNVRALARSPARLKEAVPDLGEVAKGDVLDSASLDAALDGVDLVISLLGTALTLKPVTLLSAGTRNVIEAMKRRGVKRILCVTGMGAGDSRGHGGFAYDRLILPTLLRTVYADKNRQEDELKGSGLEWTIVRPARLTDGPRTAAYREIGRFTNERMTTISRKDVAHFLAKEAVQNRYARQSVNLTQ